MTIQIHRVRHNCIGMPKDRRQAITGFVGPEKRAPINWTISRTGYKEFKIQACPFCGEKLPNHITQKVELS